MPKKTLKQKVLTERRLQSTDSYVFSYSSNVNKKQINNTNTGTQNYIKTDIRKTAILGSLFIMIEFALYFFLGVRK